MSFTHKARSAGDPKNPKTVVASSIPLRMWFGGEDSEACNLKEVSFPNEVHLNEK